MLDAVVVGLGAMGANALLHLARSGARVSGFEQFAPGHARGASHGETRIIRTAYAEGANYVPLLKRAWELWAQLEALTGQRLLLRTGGLFISPKGSGRIEAPIASARAHGLAYEVYDAADLRRFYPQHRVDPDTVAFHEADAGILRPEASIVAAVQAAHEAGATVHSGTRVTRIVPDPARPAVWVGDEEFPARHVIVAAGGWTGRLLPAMAPHVDVVRRVVAWFEPGDAAEFAPDRFPIFIRTAKPLGESGSFEWYGMPGFGSPPVKVALHTLLHAEERVDPDAGVRPPDEHDARLIEGLVHEALPGLRPEPVRLQACMYSNTPDRDFAVGRHPDLPGLILLAGFSGHGFKFAPVIGEIASQLALVGQSSLDMAFLAPDRFSH